MFLYLQNKTTHSRDFCPILTPKFGNLPISGNFCAIEIACKFWKPLFLFESSLFPGYNNK